MKIFEATVRSLGCNMKLYESVTIRHGMTIFLSILRLGWKSRRFRSWCWGNSRYAHGLLTFYCSLEKSSRRGFYGPRYRHIPDTFVIEAFYFDHRTFIALGSVKYVGGLSCIDRVKFRSCSLNEVQVDIERLDCSRVRLHARRRMVLNHIDPEFPIAVLANLCH